ncbi:MAG: restriction endonuclease subunit S [Rhodanobacter lindaniclasticus]
MKSRFPTVELGSHVRQVSQRNRTEAAIEVFSVTNSEGFTRSTDYFNKEVFSKDVSNYKVVTPGQFAYNPSRINVGSVDYLRHTSAVLVSPLYIVFSCKKDLHPDFLLRYLKSNWGNAQIRANTEGAVRDSLKYKGLESIELPLPLPVDQIRIAHLLGKVEGLIAQRKQQLAQLDALLKSVFLEMFGDPTRNDRDWDKPPLRSFGKITTGNTPPRNDPSNYDSPYIEWIKTDNITADAVVVTKAAEYLSETGAKRARTVDAGALLVACIAGSVESIGRVALTDRTVAFNQQINAIQPGADVDPIFLYALFKLSRIYIQSHATKGMKKILTKGDFEQIPMVKPPFELQREFAVIAKRIEALKSRYQQTLTDLETLYSALSQSAFKGELDLSRIPLPAPALEPAPMEDATAVTIDLDAPALPLPDLGLTVEELATEAGRLKLLTAWLTASQTQLNTQHFELTAFLHEAEARLQELYPGSDLELGMAAYEQIKDWVFATLDAGQLVQELEPASKRIALKHAHA